MKRKAQEEIVGFVAIILIVCLVVVFFLGITLRNQDQKVGESKTLVQFIESTKKYTTECDIGFREKYVSVEKVAQECYRNSEALCINGLAVCKVYNETMEKILDSNWKVGEDRPIKGYVWSMNYETKQDSKQIIAIEKGNCEGQYNEEESLSPDSVGGGTFVSRFKTCF